MTMKYLFLILVCCAVKCEDVGNNYYVVKTPEDIRQQDIKNFKKPFKVYWNVPTMQCASKKIPFQNLFENFGIIQNDSDRFIGNKIVVIYDEKDFPAVINNKTAGKNILRNGGVPQEGNLEHHLIAFENDLNVKIPDPYFDGIAIIDFESWRPVFRQNFGALEQHKHLSMEIEKQLHNWWPKMWIEKEATIRFEAAARKFMQTTLSMAKELRPNALWGYYGFPYCFNMRNKDWAEKCANSIDKENDSIYWLWAESTALFPSLYSPVSLTSSQLSFLIKGRVKEASRVRGIDTPIFPYFWYRYRDDGFMTEKDLEAALTTLYQSDASGFIIWGSSNDVNTVDKCNKLLKYVETVLGPKIAKYTKKIKSIHSGPSENKESSVVNNKFTKAEEISQTLNNDEMFSTESTIKYNDYTYSDDLQTLTNFDLFLYLSGSSTYNEYSNRDQNIPTMNNDETFTTEFAITYDEHTYIDENLKSLNNDDLFSFLSEPSTASYEYTNFDQSLQTQNNDEISSNGENTIAYNDYSNTEESAQILNNDNLKLSLSEYSTLDNANSDHSTNTLNIDKVSLENLLIKNYNDTINNANLISLSKSSIVDNENSDPSITTLKNEEISLENTSTENLETTDNVDLSKSSIFDYENSDHSTTTLNNDQISLGYISPKNFVDTINNNNEISSSKFPNFDYEKSDHSTTLNDNEISLVRLSTIDNSNRDESSQTFNYEESAIVYNKYSDTEENFQTLNYVDRISSSESSIIIKKLNYDEMTSNKKEISSKGTSIIYDDFVNEDQHTDSLNTIKNLSYTLPALEEITYIDKSTDILNYGEIVTDSNEIKTTGNDVLNNNALLHSSEDQFDYLIKVDDSTNIENFKESENKDSTNVDNDYLIIVRNIKNKQNFKENITDSKLETVLDTTQADNIQDTVTTSETIFRERSNDLVVTYIDKKYEIKKNEVSTSTKKELLQNISLLNSDDDTSDYLIKVDNSTKIETYSQSDNINIKIDDDDYLVIVPDFNNKIYEENNILDNNLNLDLYSKTQTEFVPVSDTKIEEFDVTVKDLDPIVAYINKTLDNLQFQDSNEYNSTEGESNKNKVFNSDENTFDYLIKPGNFTNKETIKQYEYKESTIAENDYIIIIKNLDD